MEHNNYRLQSTTAATTARLTALASRGKLCPNSKSTLIGSPGDQADSDAGTRRASEVISCLIQLDRQGRCWVYGL